MLTSKRIQEVEEVLKRLEHALSGVNSLAADEKEEDSTPSRARLDKLRVISNKTGSLIQDVQRLYS